MVKSFAVVVQTHKVTPSLTERLQLARSQLSRGGVALYITLLVGDGPTHRCGHQPALQQLRAAVGPKAVWCLDPPSYEAVWPQFFSSLATLPHRDRYPKQSAIGGFNWAWTMCDLHAVVGALTHRPEYEYLWVLDHDLGWTGDLLEILRQFDTVDADLLTADEATAHRNDSGFHQQVPCRTEVGPRARFGVGKARLRHALARDHALVHRARTEEHLARRRPGGWPPPRALL